MRRIMEKLSVSSQKHKKLPTEAAVYSIRELSVVLKMDKEPMFAITPSAIRKLTYLLDVPFASFGGREKYITIEEKAAALFYHATKDHLFENGNKRTAVILTMIFLFINGRWLKMSPDEMYDLSLKVAGSDSSSASESYDLILQEFQKTAVDTNKAA